MHININILIWSYMYHALVVGIILTIFLWWRHCRTDFRVIPHVNRFVCGAWWPVKRCRKIKCQRWNRMIITCPYYGYDIYIYICMYVYIYIQIFIDYTYHMFPKFINSIHEKKKKKKKKKKNIKSKTLKPSIVSNNINQSGGLLKNTSEKYEFFSWNDKIPNLWKPKKWCSKPPNNISRIVHPINHSNILDKHQP